MKIASLGYGSKEKTYAELFTREQFPDAEILPFSPIRNVVAAVEAEKVDISVVPIENFYDGDVRQTLDALLSCQKTRVIGERTSEIIHCLGALPDHTKITQILSKDEALGQCGDYIAEHYPEALTFPTSNTVEAVKKIADLSLPYAAAIASKQAIESSGLEVLATDICPNNTTRFFILGRTPTEPSGDDKTYIAIHPPLDKPGVLSRALKFIADPEINLVTLQSRPDRNKGYRFYIELAGHEQDKDVEKALRAIRLSLDPKKQNPNTLKVLGSYKNTHWKK